MSFDRKLRKRLTNDINHIRQAINERVESDKVLTSEWLKLEALANQIQAVIEAGSVAIAKNQESEEVMAGAFDKLADTSTLIVNQSYDPDVIRNVLLNAPDINIKVAIKLSDKETLDKWKELLDE